MLSPSHIVNIAHPNILNAYVKQDLTARKSGNQVLVLETNIDLGNDEDGEDKYLDLLSDLNEIQAKAQKEYGNISRVDIRAHTYH